MGLDFSDIRKLFGEISKDLAGNFGMAYLAAPKAHAHLNFGAIFKELTGVAESNLRIMFASLGSKAHFFDFDLLLSFSSLTFAFCLFVLIFAEIEYATHRWLRVWRHLHQIQITLLRERYCLAGRHNAKLFPILGDDPHLRGANSVVDANTRRALITFSAASSFGYGRPR